MRFAHLSETDCVLLSAGQELGRTVRFMVLRDFLVRTGMSSNHAQVSIQISPLIENVSRGFYTFIADPTLIELSQVHPIADSDLDARA